MGAVVAVEVGAGAAEEVDVADGGGDDASATGGVVFAATAAVLVGMEMLATTGVSEAGVGGGGGGGAGADANPVSGAPVAGDEDVA